MTSKIGVYAESIKKFVTKMAKGIVQKAILGEENDD